MNPDGHPPTLRPGQPGNLNALKHGAYAQRALSPRAREVADALLEGDYVLPVDRIGAEVVGRIVDKIELIDEYLDENGLVDARGKERSVLGYQTQLVRQLERMLAQYLATPAARARLAERLEAGEDVVAILRRELGLGVVLLEAARDRGDLRLPSPPEEQS